MARTDETMRTSYLIAGVGAQFDVIHYPPMHDISQNLPSDDLPSGQAATPEDGETSHTTKLTREALELFHNEVRLSQRELDGRVRD
ncbi:hypothetical protein LTR53_010768 [Teratosphaeriaceae sp. CCFEE 6253]|nr:hypothetical protein LTR53_010768 [Teratosphaeriaceae sp. CCFEE 6253]